tara:strand:- start:4268 stop:5422 length:1155 start_codon:yes stop_codon:yes gene_type:complete
MKVLFNVIILLILFSCSSNPKNVTLSNFEERIIEKPQINYKLNSLPRDINVIYFSNSKSTKPFPDEVKGLLTNFYSFSDKYKYFPNIRFINLNKANSCSLVLDRSAYNFIFLLKDSFETKPYELCLNKFANRDVLLISDFDNRSALKNFRQFRVNRNDDKYKLINYMRSFSKTTMVIDNEITKDKYEIGKFWEEELNKETAEYRTFDKTESGQYIFSYLLLLEQSLKRKRKLSRMLSVDLNLQPRTREDIDALFLSVSTQEARSLKPALDYNYYEGMKVFLANDWKGDSQFLKNDKDLEDVISIDIPFMLPLPLPSDLNTLNNKTRNFAIGYDAFEIALLMEGSRNLNKTAYKGLTGKITFKDNTIKRNSIIFKIKNGKYEYLN